MNAWPKTIIKWLKFDDYILKKTQVALNYAKNYYNSGLSLKKIESFSILY
jgi:hypothetical protein